MPCTTNLFFAITSYAVLCGQIYGTGTRIEEDCPLANVIEQENLRTVGLPLSSLLGKWVSQTCETRTESKYPYLLRSYTFHPNHSFDLLQIFYEDEFCSSAVYAIAARGYLNWNWNSNRRLNYYLSRVTIVLHDINAAAKLTAHVNKACPNMTAKFWKPHVEYPIFALNTMTDGSFGYGNEAGDNVYAVRSKRKHVKNPLPDLHSISDPNCLLFSLDISFDELFDARIYRRPFKNGFKDELFLGREHSRLNSKSKTMKNSFQLPLALYNKSLTCLVCTAVAASSQMFVPAFHRTLKLPPWADFHGEWISERCEPVPQERFDGERSLFELFVTRNFRIDWDSRQWELHTKYYSHPSCGRLLAEQQSYGLGYEGVDSKIVPGATEVDFETEKSFLIFWDSSLLNRIEDDPDCGQQYYWEVGVKVEMPEEFCSKSRFTFLHRRNIMKIDYAGNEEGNAQLYLGEDEQSTERSKDFGYPLVRCSSLVEWKFWSADSSATATANWFLLAMTVALLVNQHYLRLLVHIP